MDEVLPHPDELEGRHGEIHEGEAVDEAEEDECAGGRGGERRGGRGAPAAVAPLTEPTPEQVSVVTVASQQGQYLDRSGSSALVDVVDLILDKGLVIDVYVRVSLVGIELLTIDARIVVASVDTYLRFAEATNRLDLARSGTETRGLPGLMEEMREGGGRQKTKGALEGVKDSVSDLLHGDEEEDAEESQDEKKEEVRRRDPDDRPRRKRSTSSHRERER
jgi:gas vesicle structural protein